MAEVVLEALGFSYPGSAAPTLAGWCALLTGAGGGAPPGPVKGVLLQLARGSASAATVGRSTVTTSSPGARAAAAAAKPPDPPPTSIRRR